MKKLFALLLILALSLCTFTGCLESTGDENQGVGGAGDGASTSNLGHYHVVIDSCRLAEDYEGKPVVIIKYLFTNNDDEAAAFMWTLTDEVYQDGVELEHCYLVDDSANYSSDNQDKKIKQGVTIEVEVAYIMNDTTTDINVEVSELISFSNKKVTKTFTL